MARGIMANKADNVESPTSEEQNDITTTIASNVYPTKPNATATETQCSCTKISTMQLFYEMKQKFPAVPDNVTYECVGQNCHNVLACIECLEDYPNSAKVYPQALRNQPTKKKTQQCAQMTNICDKQDPIQISDLTKENQHTNEQNASNLNGNSVQMTISKSPNTLNLTNLNCCTRPSNRPTRQAPPPPMTTITTPTTPTTTTTIKTLPQQKPLNLSVNVIVSPVSPPLKPQHPLSNYSFTLHQPNSNRLGNTTINPTNEHSIGGLISNGPSLKYTSSAYDSEIGYQSRFEITVAGTTGNTSSDYDNQMIHKQNDASCISVRKSCEFTTENTLPSVVASSEFLEETEIIHHQILCKQKLLLESERDQKRLERMQRELEAIQAPIPEGGVERLNVEVEQLRIDCKLMAQHVEEAGPSYALGETNEAFYRNIYTGQQLPMAQRHPLRPHRPAPIPDIRLMQNHKCMPNQENAMGGDPRFVPTATITQSTRNRNLDDTSQDTGWICDLCTFQNKYTQQTCEACTKPFLSAGNNGIYVPSSSQPIPQPSLASYLPENYMPMPMLIPMHLLPYNNNDNISHMHYQPSSMSP